MGVPPKKISNFFPEIFCQCIDRKSQEVSPIIMGDRDPLFPLLLEGGRAKLHLKMEDF